MLSTLFAWLIYESFALVQVRKRLRQTEILILDEASRRQPLPPGLIWGLFNATSD